MISSQNTITSSAANGSATTFAYDFYLRQQSDLIVTLLNADGSVATAIAYTGGATGDNSGGSIVFATAPANGLTVVIHRNTYKDQDKDYVANDDFPSDSHENALDQSIILHQEMSRGLKSTLRVPAYETDELPAFLKAERLNKLVGFGATGAPLLYGQTSVIYTEGEILSVPNVAQLDALDITASGTTLVDGSTVRVLGYYAEGDGGGGIFHLVTSSTTITPILRSVSGESGRRWKRIINEPFDNPRWFGAKIDGATDDRAAFVACAANRGCVFLSPGTMYWSAGIEFDYTARTDSFCVFGCGKGISKILCNDTDTAFSQIDFKGNSSAKNNVTLRDFTIGRATPTNYVGVVGPKTVFVANGKDVVIEGIEEYGAIGFGIQVDYCSGALIRGCHVHDHKGGATPSSGFDGIHIYRSTDTIVESNRVERVGDDGISFGSFLIGFPIVGFIARGNITTDTGAGGINVYGHSSDGVIDANIIKSAYAGGVKLWDPYNSTYSIKNVTISNNRIYESGAPGSSAGITLNQTTGSGLGEFEDVTITGNHCFDCSRGITIVSSVSNKGSRRVRVLNNWLKRSGQWGIWTNYCHEYLEIRGNHIEDTGTQAIYCNNSEAFTRCVICDNVIKNYNMDNVASGHGIWARSGQMSIIWIVTGNVIYDPAIAASSLPSTGSMAYEMSDISSPLSIYDQQLVSTLKSGGVQFPTAGGQGNNFRSGNAPTTGTWRRGTVVWKVNSGSGSPAGWLCTTSGTFRTISGLTAVTTSGSNIATITGGAVFAGEYITIAGVSGTLTVRDYNADTGVIQLISNADATVSGATITRSAPVFRAMANLA